MWIKREREDTGFKGGKRVVGAGGDPYSKLGVSPFRSSELEGGRGEADGGRAHVVWPLQLASAYCSNLPTVTVICGTPYIAQRAVEAVGKTVECLCGEGKDGSGVPRYYYLCRSRRNMAIARLTAVVSIQGESPYPSWKTPKLVDSPRISP